MRQYFLLFVFPLPIQAMAHFSSNNSCYDEANGIYHSQVSSPLHFPLNPHLDFVTYILSRNLTKPELNSKVAIIDAKSGERFTYGELKAATRSVAAGLNGIGIRKNDVVMVLLANTVHFPVIFNAVLSIGAVVTTMNPINTSAEIARQMSDSDPVLIITSAEHLQKIKISLVKLNKSSKIVLLGNQSNRDSATIPYSALTSADATTLPVVHIRQSDTAALLYSSGTTGLSKGVVLSHGNLISTMVIADTIPDELANDEDITLVLFPMYHIGGLIWLACGAVFGRATLVLLPKYNILDLASAIEKHKVTKITSAPPVILDLLKNPATKNYNLHSLKALVCAAAPLGKDSMEALITKFPHITLFIQLYGMTETTTVGSGGVGPYGSVGKLKPSMEAKVVDLDTQTPLPPHKQGELWLRGPSIMQGYLNNPVATAEAIDKEGWLHTGDLVYFDDNGYLYIIDRLKELIKYKGYQVAPAEIEALLLTHPSISDCAVVPFTDQDAGEIPMAYVVCNPGMNLTSQQVINFASSQLAPYKKIRKVVFVDTVPKSPSGKILRKELKHLAHSKL